MALVFYGLEAGSRKQGAVFWSSQAQRLVR